MKKVFLALLAVLALGTLAACGGDPDPESVSLDESSVTIDVGDSVTVIATVDPSDADQGVEWSSDDEAVATVEDGEITGVAEGSATITATSTADDSLSASVEVTVEEEGDDPDPDPDGPESVELSDETLELEIDEQYLLEASVLPEGENQAVTWSTSDDSVVTVSGGVVEGIATGTATVTATSDEDDSVSASVEITVIEELWTTQEVKDADADTEVFVEGVVTSINKDTNFFIQDSAGGIAIDTYGNDDLSSADVEVGDTIRVKGTRDSFSELLNVSATSIEVLSSDNDLPEAVNLSEEAGAFADLMPYQSSLVSLNKFIVVDMPSDMSGSFNVGLVGYESGETIAIRVEGDSLPADGDVIYSLEEGDIIDINGAVLGWYYGAQIVYTGGEASLSDMGNDSLSAYRVDSYISAEHTLPWAEAFESETGTTLTITSSNTGVVTVDGYTLTGEAEGAAIVTVANGSGDVISHIFVVVHPLEVQVNDALNDDDQLRLRTTEEFVLDYTVLPGEAVSQDVTITSDDEAVVSIDAEGNLVANAEGTATLTITSDVDPNASMTLDILVADSEPTLDYFDSYTVYQNDPDFDVLQDVVASDYIDGDITADVVQDGTVDLSTIGEYTVDISVTNSFGNTAEGTITVEVVEEGAVIAPTGTYNFQYVDSHTRHTLFAAAERYLMETAYGGIPATINAGYALYSARTQLPVEEPVPVMNYGALMFSTFSEDDSNVTMDDGSAGEAGEYTYRVAETNDPGQYNQWLYDDSISSDLLTIMLDSLYYFDFNEDNTGYAVLPSMAEGMPNAVNGEVNEYGVELSKTWEVNIKDNLEWYFDEDIDYPSDSSSYETEITPDDFIATYKLALEENWFRAISGGGDFTTAPQAIVGAQEFADGEGSWEDVGLKAVDTDSDGTNDSLEFEFIGDMSEWNIIYWLSSFVTTPIHMGLYDEVGDQYGTSPETTATHGAYYLSYYEPDKTIRFRENPTFHDPDRYFFTGYDYSIIADTEIMFQEFLSGKLEAAAVPGAQYEAYQNDPRIKAVPGATTFRASINSLGTVEAQQEQFPGSEFVPEPLLAWENDEASFRNALFHAFDRQTIASEVQVTAQPGFFYFSEAYLVAPQEGVSFREWDNLEANRRAYIETLDNVDSMYDDDYDETAFQTWLEDNRDPEATVVGEGLGMDTLGYNPDLATRIFEDAIEDLTSDGTYDMGTADEPLVIPIQFTIQAGSSAQSSYAEFLKDEFQRIFSYEDDNGDVLAYVDIEIDPVEFPDNYYTRILVGATDMGQGGISGSTLDAASFLDVFADDNRGGFTMDWGIDTSTANIEVTYVNRSGVEVTELWSYNALVTALNGTAQVQDGEEVE